MAHENERRKDKDAVRDQAKDKDLKENYPPLNEGEMESAEKRADHEDIRRGLRTSR